jgi:hypothetical protein
MRNTAEIASKWVDFLANRPEFPAGSRFLAAFKAGRISRLCDCGCNSFDVDVPSDSSVEPLTKPGRYGAVFEIDFRTTEENATLEFVVFVGANGHLAGVNVDYCANTFPVPEAPCLIEPPYHVRSSESLQTQGN